jgi:hypothetical protein
LKVGSKFDLVFGVIAVFQVWWFVALAAMGCMTAWAQGVPLRLVTILALDRPVVVAERSVLDAAFARTGLRFTLEYNPAERALVGLRDGTFDGDINRNDMFGQSYPQAIRVEPHIQSAYFYAVGVSTTNKPSSWADLGRFSIAYVRGFKGIEIRTVKVPQREVTDSDESCLMMAAARHVDWCILPTDSKGAWPLKEQFAQRLNGVLIDTVKVYIWLGPHHAETAQRLTRALREMEKSGELQKTMALFRQAD